MKIALIDGPAGRPFAIPAEPQNTREHAEWISRQVFDGEYDHAELPADVVTAVDVGAHVGSFVAWAAHRWPSLQTVHCYDPNEAALELAFANAHPRLRVYRYPAAVTEQPKAYFGLPWDWGSAKTHQISAQEGKSVPTVHPRNLPACDVLKCDSEGTEIEVLNHFQHWATLKALLVEFHCPDHRVAQRKIATARGFRCLSEVDHEYGVAIWVRA